MANFKTTIITKKGHALMAKLSANVATMKFTKVCSSDFDYSNLNNSELEQVVTFKNLKQTVLPDLIKVVNTTTVKVNATITNTNLTEGYYLRTIGLFALDPDEGEILYSITPTSEADYMAADNGITKSGISLDLLTTISNSENVNLQIDPNATISADTFYNVVGDVAALENEGSNLVDGINKNTTSLNDKANVVNTTSMYLGTFFESNDNIGNNLFITGDGKSLLKINNNNVFKGRDVSILCKGGTFYFFHTAIGGTDNITVKISKDLVNFETKNIKVSDDNSTLWAPDVFVDGEKIYLVYAKSVGNELGANGQTYNDMRPYIVEIINLETMDIGVPRELILQGNSKVSDNRIDGHIIKKDSTYYLFIKFNGMNGVDANGAIEIWTSSDLNAWTIINSGINSWSGIEAPFVTEFDGTYYLYVDDFTPLNYASGDFYKNNGGVTMYTTSTDLINWSTELKVLNSEKSLRHGFICKIEDEDCKRILTNRSVSLINLALKNIKDDYNEKINKVNDSIQSLEDATNVKGYYNNIFVNLSSISSYGMYRGFIPLKNATNYNITLTKMSYMNNVETIEITDTASIGDIYMNGFCVRNTNSVVAGASCLVWFRVEDK